MRRDGALEAVPGPSPGEANCETNRSNMQRICGIPDHAPKHWPRHCRCDGGESPAPEAAALSRGIFNGRRTIRSVFCCDHEIFKKTFAQRRLFSAAFVCRYASRSSYPTPRIVWVSLGSPGRSTLSRTYFM